MKTYDFAIRHGVTYEKFNDSEWWNIIIDGEVRATITTSELDALTTFAGYLASHCDLGAEEFSDDTRKAFDYYTQEIKEVFPV